ncbi:MAG: hypothetical protein ACRDY1_01700 [Acidimicrobiales bacterium]
MPLLGTAGIASARTTKAAKAAAKCAKHPTRVKCNGGGGSTGSTGGTTGGPPVQIEVTASPNPLVETGQSEIHTVIQVETLPAFAGDAVNIDSSQLASSCESVMYETVRNGLPPQTSPDAITTVLDDDGNATVVVDGINCAPGTSVIEADLEQAPYLTALTQLVAQPPNVTPAGLTGYPNNEVETGDTNTGINGASGNSDVYAVFYVEDSPVYAEQTVEIDSTQLDGRCGLGWWWQGGNGGTTATQTGTPVVPAGINTGPEATTTLDDDGNAVFVFKGVSCAAGDSQVIADVLAGTHDTFTFDFNIVAPQPTI